MDETAGGGLGGGAVRRPHKEQSRSKLMFKRLVRRAKRLNRTHAVHGDRPVFDVSVFPWVPGLEAAYPKIRAELERVLERKDEIASFHELLPDSQTVTNDALWKAYYFTGYGITSKQNIAACPDTWAALQHVPNLRTAMFSILEPGKHIPAHKGPYNGVLRVHLGLILPQPVERVQLRVLEQRLHWQEGKVLVFDDSFEHEVWNDTDGVRVVLFLDIDKPLRFPANLVNRALLGMAPFTPYVREAEEQQKAWEARFYKRL